MLQAAAHRRSDADRGDSNAAKTGVRVPSSLLSLTHPLSGESVPVFVADYVLTGKKCGVFSRVYVIFCFLFLAVIVVVANTPIVRRECVCF
jgi:hypothetical protein